MPVPTSTRSLPDPTVLLFLAAFGVAVAVLFLERGPLQVSIIGVAAAPCLLVLAYLLAVRSSLSVVLLVVASAMPRAAVSLGSLNVRPEHVVGGLLCVSAGLIVVAGRSRSKWVWADWMLVAYMVVNLVSSRFMSPDPSQTTKWAIEQLLGILPYFILRILASNRDAFRRAFNVLLVVGACAAAYALVVIYSNLLFSTTFGLDLDEYGGGVPAVYGTQYEPNLLGSYCGACAVMMLVMYIKTHRKPYLVGYMVTAAGMAVSYSRAALMATIAIALPVMAYALWKKWAESRIYLRVIVATVVVAVVLSPIVIKAYAERFSTIDTSNPAADPNTLSRTLQLATGLEQILEHPVLGSGTASFQLMAQFPGRPDLEEQPWLGNTEIRVLHDTGAVGLTVFAAFVIALVFRARRRLKGGPFPELLALLLGCSVYAITFQATEGTLLAFTWVHLGLIGCAVALPAAVAGKNGSAGAAT